MKLGELLIKAGRITTAQLEETLKGQAIFGGRFGTNLVEMGYLDEHDLAHFLSKKTGIAHASPEQLMDVPPQVTRLIPEEAVRKYQVMPLALNNRKLTVAMTDPTDFATIDEISFLTGYIVVPVITPELRLVCALEKHYNIRRDVRYIRVEGGGRNRARVAQSAAPEPEPPRQAMPAPSRPAPESPPAGNHPPGTPRLNGPLPATAPFSKLAPPVPDDDILELPLLADYECFGDMEKSEPLGAYTQAGSALQREAEKECSVEGILHGLTQAHDRHGIAQLIVDYAARQFDRSALFLLKGGKATGWVAQCGKKTVPKFDLLEIPLADPSVLKVVAESKTYYLGPLPVSHYNGRMIAALGGGNPVNNLLIPLMMMGRVVAILYVEGGTLQLDQRLPELQKLLGKASMAFEILILKNKILLA
ncbi:MAG: general secretion pathway protein [Geobacteraceae bacterium GWC2_58_44]|nr:MAG: general secretion pathway protein [Geobacteraceae bacterium GWC2_58_44]